MIPSGHRAYLVTPHGTGAIAVIRLVGPDPEAVLRGVWECGADKTLTEGRLRYGQLMDGEGTLDDVLLSVESVSGDERAVEISCHGGVYIVQRILRLLEQRGATIETEDHGSLAVWPADNKTEAEAIEALTHVKTQRAVRYAAWVRYALPQALEKCLLHDAQYRQSLAERLKEFMSGFDAACALLRGVTVCLIGPPNTGKSSLFNALLGRQAVVTSPIAGTTRDWIAETVEFEGLAVELVDTAGWRETQCELERQAIEIGNYPLVRSDLVFLVLDQSASFPVRVTDWANIAAQKTFVVGNKTDLRRCWTDEDLTEIERATGSPPMFVSARTGEGCELLKKAILKHFGLLDPDSAPMAFFTERQRSIAMQALAKSKDPAALCRQLLTLNLAEMDCKGL